MKTAFATGILILCMFSFEGMLHAQTCCSGGVPLANNVGGLPEADKGTFQLSVNFDGNFLRTLKDGNEKLDDRTRERTTYSFLVKSVYTISNKVSVEALLTGVRQERKINQGGFEDFTRTTGLGDAVAMIYYDYYKNSDYEFTFGAGPKIPIGPSDLKNENGITLNADLQPGSGAWDLLLHHRISKKLAARPSTVLTNLVTYRLTGENTDYLGSQVYEFGNELQIVMGASEQKAFGDLLMSYGLNIRYRHAQQDKNNEALVPGTGGQWVFVNPAVSWYMTPDLAFTLNGEFPVYSEVKSTQLTPTYRINAGILLSLKKKNKELIKIEQ